MRKLKKLLIYILACNVINTCTPSNILAVDYEIIDKHGWIYYVAKKEYEHDPDKVGKWMYFFKNKKFAEELCREAVKNGIVNSAKHSKYTEERHGVICFYLNCDDLLAHKRVISFFISHNLIKKDKSGRFYDIPFKLDKQTLAGEYGKDFHALIRLSDFINLDTGKWKLD